MDYDLLPNSEIYFAFSLCNNTLTKMALVKSEALNLHTCTYKNMVKNKITLLEGLLLWLLNILLVPDWSEFGCDRRNPKTQWQVRLERVKYEILNKNAKKGVLQTQIRE